MTIVASTEALSAADGDDSNLITDARLNLAHVARLAIVAANAQRCGGKKIASTDKERNLNVGLFGQ
jgi:hypothetical protein